MRSIIEDSKLVVTVVSSIVTSTFDENEEEMDDIIEDDNEGLSVVVRVKGRPLLALVVAVVAVPLLICCVGF